MSIPKKDAVFDLALRPTEWADYIGQESVKSNLKILIEAAKGRNEPIDHILLYGPAGLGKTTLANLIAKKSGSQIRITSGPAIEKVGDLASILTGLAEGDILFIDEVHRLNKLVEEILYPAMENSVLDIIIGKGPSAKTIQLQLPRFTIIAATTKIGSISSPLRSRFGATYRLDFYTKEEIEKILERSAALLDVLAEKEALELISKVSRSTPRIANRILKRVRDYSQVNGSGMITKKLAKEALELMEIDEIGLERADIKLLETIIEKYSGGPVGLKTLAASTFEEEETIEDVHEPYLLQIGFLARTPQGRTATKKAYEHLGINFSEKTLTTKS
ncbi:Holliday junction branch migration DNA helicase RuvB [Candidatus Azambacteria bacterium]|nr:Holliday junction branch migration DNA helicase RuvB [Candidatus Azambacteria bacterium]